MPLQMDIKKKLQTRTGRVKSVDFHPTEPWVLSALYSGNLVIHNWEEQSTVKTIEVCPNVAIRCAKFIARKQWIICGSDDMMLRVFNYHSTEKIKEFDAHTDFIRYIAVHPSLPLVLTASDDMSVRVWDWSKSWTRLATFEGHLHYVMMCRWNPKDSHIFATASLDRTIKIWGINVQGTLTGAVINRPHFNLIGHESGVNTVDYSPNSEKPYIVSGGDDKSIRVWDYQTKQCLTILTDHQKLVLCASFHPYLPIILSGGEDCSIKVWHTVTYREEVSINYDLGRIWAIATDTKTNAVAFATDQGTVVIKIGSDRAIASMHSSKITFVKGCEIQTINLKLTDKSLYSDGEIVPVSVKDLGSCEVFPQMVQHHPNGRLLAVCGDGEFVIYTAQALRSKAYGRAIDFCWSSFGDYAIRLDTGKIIIYQSFKEHLTYTPVFPVDKIFGGQLLGLRSSDFICFYDWKDFKLKRRINVLPEHVFWNESGTLVVLACEELFYLLKYNAKAVEDISEQEDEQAAESAFELEKEVAEKVDSGCWINDCFAFTTDQLRVQTLIAKMVDTLAFLDNQAWILGYFPETNCLYLVERSYTVISFRLHLSFIEYVSAICRHDYSGAAEIFKRVPEDLYNKVGSFLEWQGQKEMALEVTQDLNQKFEIARVLGKLDICARLIQEVSAMRGVGSEKYYKEQWRQLGDLALERGALKLAEACMHKGQDYNSLLLIYSSTCNVPGLRHLAKVCEDCGATNISLLCYVMLQDFDECVNLLIKTDRLPEAALFAKTYSPSRIAETVELWKKKLEEMDYSLLAASLATPKDNPELFPDYEESLKLEMERKKKQSDTNNKQVDEKQIDIEISTSNILNIIPQASQESKLKEGDGVGLKITTFVKTSPVIDDAASSSSKELSAALNASSSTQELHSVEDISQLDNLTAAFEAYNPTPSITKPPEASIEQSEQCEATEFQDQIENSESIVFSDSTLEVVNESINSEYDFPIGKDEDVEQFDAKPQKLKD